MLIEAPRSSLLIVDVQQGLAPVMSDPRRVYRGCILLLRAATRLGLPVVLTEQYPKGLGATSGEVMEWAPEGAVMEKLHFSCAADEAILARLKGTGRDQVVIAGIESHICVLQSALGLLAAGFKPVVVADACASRDPANYQAAMARLAAAGVGVVTVEMVIFEWLHRAGTPEFKELSALIK
ncbi:hydrolase [Paramagnetospirillum magneticum]|uniref:Amidase related to nicotinamidase n=1 Tax=Paramagnetospirillum magneticum (strain ATCC 700264 / AMB-1) TaxID=342108 RepID=Q2W7I5_PARM1|nr:hydrolase [Paramagnetospirillum magneticum]BAE50190.1 Amidase related to nicotinamidase [Paramagnetospirillum magneticum AMB-1]